MASRKRVGRWTKNGVTFLEKDERTDDEIHSELMTAGLKDITRFEVIDKTGRAYVKWGCKVTASVQDKGKTLKVFVE